MLNIPKHTDIHNTTHNIVFTGLIVILLANILTSSLFEEQQHLLSFGGIHSSTQSLYKRIVNEQQA